MRSARPFDVQKQLAGSQAAMTQAIQQEWKRISRKCSTPSKELAERREKKSQGGRRRRGGGAPQPLVPPVAELRMLRILQLGINTRTVVVNEQSGVLPKDQLDEQHKDLAARKTR